MFVSNNRTSFHLWWKENLVKHGKVSKYYQTDCRSCSRNALILQSLLICSFQVCSFKINHMYLKSQKSFSFIYVIIFKVLNMRCFFQVSQDLQNFLETFHINVRLTSYCIIASFLSQCSLFFPLKMCENLWLSDIFKGYRNETLSLDGLKLLVRYFLGSFVPSLNLLLQ